MTIKLLACLLIAYATGTAVALAMLSHELRVVKRACVVLFRTVLGEPGGKYKVTIEEVENDESDA